MSSAKSTSTSNDRTGKKSLEKPPIDGFHIVGIGSSAGGLETLEKFFKNLPADTGMAFVVVSHQHLGHVSRLPEILNKYAPIPVVEAVDGVLLKSNHVYVSPPGAHLDMMNRKLQLLDGPPGEMPPLPIDFFFRALAIDQKERAICIVLSGTGTDGTLGLKAVKDESGMAMVQEVKSARFTGMPASAIATSQADYVLPPADMPAQLVAYARGMTRNRTLFESPALEPEMVEPFQKIFMLLRSRTGHDFSQYKKNSLLRRIRELLVNVMKHSDAKRSSVHFAQMDGCAHICVEDDGVGFDAEMAGKGFSPTGGFGLFNIGKYCQNAGGNLHIESNRGEGTRVVLSVPLEAMHEY